VEIMAMEDMEKLMRGEKSQTSTAAANKKTEIKDENDPDFDKELSLAPSGLPNPLGMRLHKCHIPHSWIEHKDWIMRYCEQHFSLNDMQSVSASEPEQELHGIYIQACRDHGLFPISSRYFVTAVRCICRGMPLAKPKPQQLKDLRIE
jgi:hypothetical protein